MQTGDVVAPALLNEILAQSGLRLRAGAGPVSYAMSCWFRGQYVPHLVMQTDQGPVTILLLSESQGPKQPESFEEGGYRGVVIPAPRGAVAVVAQDAPLEQLAKRFIDAVDYQP